MTAQDIIFFWVARMMMAGIHFMKKPPFRNIVIHGIVRDEQGRKMSKSLGNSLDPLELIDAYSADALRFSLALITSFETDSRVSKSKFEIGRNFATKIWNAARFIEMNLDRNPNVIDVRAIASGNVAIDPTLLKDDDRHMLWTLSQSVKNITSLLEKYRLQDAALAIYELIWDKFCDWYLEYVKQDLNASDEARRNQALSLMTLVFSTVLKLLHPYMPFLTEELWHQMGYGDEDDSIMKAPWPVPFSDEQAAVWGADEKTASFVESLREMVTAGRALRAEYNIAPNKPVKYIIQLNDGAYAEKCRRSEASLARQLRAESLEITADDGHRALPCSVISIGTIYLPLDGLVDVASELERVRGELEKTRGFLRTVEAKLGNESFVSRAPAAIVEQQREQKIKLQETIERLEKLEKAYAGA